MSSQTFAQVIAKAKQLHGGSSAEFDYSLASGDTTVGNRVDNVLGNASVALDGAIWEIATADQRDADMRTKRQLADELRERIRPELDAAIAAASKRSYTGWSDAARAMGRPIRYAD